MNEQSSPKTKRKKLKNLLEAKSREQQIILDATPAMIFYKDTDNRFLRVNKAFAESMNMSTEKLEGKSLFDIYPKEQAEAYWKDDKEIFKNGRPKKKIIEPMDTSDGIRWLETDKVPYYNKKGSIAGVIGFSMDITDRKRAEEELQKLNRALRAHNDSNIVAMHAVNEIDYLNQVCRIISEDCGYRMVWIGFAERDKNKTVRPMAYSGFDQGYIDSMKITWASIKRGCGPTGSAIREGTTHICKNMMTDSKLIPWRKEAFKRGYASSIAIPLKNSNSTFGALTIYSKEPNSFTKDEVKLLSEMAADLSNGISNIRIRKALRDSETRFRRLFETIQDGMLILDADNGQIIEANPYLVKMLGYQQKEFLGRKLWKRVFLLTQKRVKKFLIPSRLLHMFSMKI